MRTLSTNLRISKNTLHSTSAWAYLVRIRYRTDFDLDTYAEIYYTNYTEAVVFNSNTFEPYPMQIGEITENSKGEATRFQLGIANIGTTLTDLLDAYWVNIEEPLWLVTLWLIDTAQPSETVLTNNDQYVVINIATTLMAASFECLWQGLGFEIVLPKRRYTKAFGFNSIPRIVR